LTIGISIILRGIMKLVWGKNRMAVPPLAGEEPLRIAGAAILPQAVAILIITALAIGLLVLFFRGTRLGLCMRAVASNQTAAIGGGHSRGARQGGQFCPGRRIGRTGRRAGDPHHDIEL
jgi:branched-chain amino acid transport system permease protein